MGLARQKISIKQIKDLFAQFKSYPIQSLSLMKSGYSNQSYRIVTKQKVFLLRFHRGAKTKKVLLESKLIRHLSHNKIPVPKPIATKKESFVTNSIWGPVTLSEFVCGTMPLPTHDSCHEIGKANAKLNLVPFPKTIKKTQFVSLRQCKKLASQFSKAKYPHPEMFIFFVEQIKLFEKPLSTPLPRGLIHGDIFPDNTLFKNDRLIAFLDFEDACFDNLLADLGRTINGFCFVRNRIRWDLVKTLVASYHLVRPLTEKEFLLLWDYIVWGSFVMYYWYVLALMHDKSPRHLKRMHFHYQRMIALRNISEIERNLQLSQTYNYVCLT